MTDFIDMNVRLFVQLFYVCDILYFFSKIHGTEQIEWTILLSAEKRLSGHKLWGFVIF